MIGDAALPPIPAAVAQSASLVSESLSMTDGQYRAERPIITTVPVAYRPAPAMSLDMMVRVAAREVLALSDEAHRRGEGGRVDLGADDDIMAGSIDTNDAVVRDHDRRIALLRTRIDASRAAGIEARSLAELNVRLLRAQAARRLAVARIAGGPDRPEHVALTASSQLLMPALASVGSAGRLRHHMVGPRRPSWSDLNQTLQSMTPPYSAPLVAPSLVDASIAVTPVHRYRSRRDAPAGLAKARRSLSIARRLLAAPVTERSNVVPSKVVASLWQWEGSAGWSLASIRSATA